MKTLRLSLIGLTAILAVLATFSSARPQCSSANTGVLGWWPKFWEDEDWGCTAEGMIDKLLNGAERLDANAVYYAHRNKTDVPEPLTTLASEAVSRRTLFIKTHGNTDGFAGVYYKDQDSRNAAYDQLVQSGWADGIQMRTDNNPPAPSIFVLKPGISEKIAASMNAERIIGAFHCYSYSSTMGSWGVSPIGPGTFIGYRDEVNVQESCDIVQTIIARMGCYSFPSYGHQTDDAIRWMEDDVAMAGNRKNQYNCGMSCLNWDVSFLDAHADRASGTINWAVRGEDPESRYLVRGYSEPDAEPEVLLTVEGRGRDGYGVVFTYTVPLDDRRYGYFDVVEIDGKGRRSPSEMFTWGERPERWEALTAMDGKSLDMVLQRPHVPAPLVEVVDGEEVPFDPGRGLGGALAPPDDSDCADVVIYSPVSEYIVPVAQHYWGYDTEQGFAIRTRSFVGSTDPLDARAVIQSVAAANEAYMEACQPDCPREYPLRPILQIVGGTMRQVLYPDDPWGSCRGDCNSYNMIYDLDGDDYPDGPVAVLPCDSLEQLESYIVAVDDWNNNRFVDADGTLQLCVGNRYGEDTSPELPEDMGEIETFYRWWGNETSPALVESDYGRHDFEEMQAAFCAVMNEGRRDVWIQGLKTSVYRLTGFMVGGYFDVGGLTTKQRAMVVAPTCESAAIWRGSYYANHCKDLLFNETEKTVAVGFVGLLNGAYEGHDYVRGLLLTELSDSWGRREPMSRILDGVVQTLRTQFPQYGRGLVFFGTHALSPADLTTTGVPSGEDSEWGLALWSRREPGAIALNFSLPEGAHVSLDVYDVAGRHVGAICREVLGRGVHTYSWSTASVPSGVYFARLRADQMVVNHKLLVVH
jgi:hypothetical protein